MFVIESHKRVYQIWSRIQESMKNLKDIIGIWTVSSTRAGSFYHRWIPNPNLKRDAAINLCRITLYKRMVRELDIRLFHTV